MCSHCFNLPHIYNGRQIAYYVGIGKGEDMKYVVLSLAVVMYALVIAFQEKKVWFTTAAAIAVAAMVVLFPGKIFMNSTRSTVLLNLVFRTVNWNVILIYVGSMAIAALFLYSKAPAAIADTLVSHSPNCGIAVVAVLTMTAVISIFVENVATVLVMAPIALSLCRKAKLDAVPTMMGLAVMSNLEGTATLVGDPPSMIFAAHAKYTFNDFFIHQGRLSIFFVVQAGLAAGVVFFLILFAHGKNKSEVSKEKVLSPFPSVLLSVMVAGLAVISFLKVHFAYASGLFVLLLGLAGIVWYMTGERKTKGETWTLIKELDWETIAFLIGVFIVVGAVSEAGLLSDLAIFLSSATKGNRVTGFVLILLVSVLVSGFIDNVPYIIVMLPVASSLAEYIGSSRELYMFALLVGSCLGGNLTPYGASANVVAMGILRKEGKPANFAGWLKIGGLFTIITTAAAAATLWCLWGE